MKRKIISILLINLSKKKTKKFLAEGRGDQIKVSIPSGFQTKNESKKPHHELKNLQDLGFFFSCVD